MKNFRVHRDKTVEINKNGHVLLQGESGVGKSTVLQAVFFALYGKVQRPCTRGTTHCSVALKLSDMKIKREHGPARLVVNDTITGDAAQELVDKRFGTVKNFVLSCYSSQSKNISILDKAPAKQKKIFEELSGSSCESDKTQIRERIKLLESERDRLRGVMDGLSRDTDDERETESLEVLKKEHSEITEKIISIEKETVTLNAKIMEMRRILPSVRDAEVKRKWYLERIEILEKKISEIKETPEVYDDLEELEKKMQRFRMRQDYLTEEAHVNEMIKDHEAEIANRLQQIISADPVKNEESLKVLEKEQQKYDNYKRVKQAIAVLKKAKVQVPVKEPWIKQKEFVENKRQQLKEQVEKGDEFIALSSLSSSCPSCREDLRAVSYDTLILASDYVSVDVEKQTEHLMARNKLELISDVFPFEIMEVCEKDRTEDIEAMKKLSDVSRWEVVERENLLKRQREKELPPPILKRKISLEKNPGKNLEDIEDPSVEYVRIKRLCEEERVKRNEKNKLTKEHQDLKKQLTIQEKILSIKIEDPDSLEKELLQYPIQQGELHRKRDEFAIRIRRKRLTETKDALKELEERLQGTYKLQSLAKQAETQSLSTKIDEVNFLAKRYLDLFFKEQILVNLIVREEKIGTEVNYLGETFSLDNESLSAGQKQRCNLAFRFAFADVCQSKFIMLDECLNNLDGETSSHILTKLKKLSEDRLILVISHGASEGIFDEVKQL